MLTISLILKPKDSPLNNIEIQDKYVHNIFFVCFFST
jgi:hypothetical protein